MNTGYVALTFDDGPHPRSTPALLAALAAGRAPAAFFLWGEHVAKHPEQAHAVRAAGMTLGNHSYTHPFLTQLDRDALSRELADTQEAVRAATGERPVFFRPPYGDTDEQLRANAARHGLTEVLWTIDTCDWAGANTAQIVEAASQVQPGGVILMHDGGYQSTIDAVPLILRMLAARGLRPGRIVPAPAAGTGTAAAVQAADVARTDPVATVTEPAPGSHALPGLAVVGD